MPHPDPIHLVIAAALTGLLTWAAVSDWINRRIPNPAVVAILGVYVVWAVANRGHNFGSEIAAAAISFVVCYGLFYFNIIGAGDAKLFAATALFAGLEHLSLFALATVLAGGAMAAISLATRPRRALVMWNLRGKGDFGRGIPYGVAIAFGGVLVAWGSLLGFPTPAMFGLGL